MRLCDLALLGLESYLEIRDGKGGKARRVYLTHAPSNFIQWLRQAQTAVFRATDAGLPMSVRLCEPLIDLSKSRLEKRCKQGMRVIGRAGCTFHDLRKSRATTLVMRGMRGMDGCATRFTLAGACHGWRGLVELCADAGCGAAGGCDADDRSA